MVASIVAKSVPNVDKSVWETSTNLILVQGKQPYENMSFNWKLLL